MGGRRILIDSDDDSDDYPPPRATTNATTKSTPKPRSAGTNKPIATKAGVHDPIAPKSAAVHRRKLGPIENDSSLLRPWSIDDPSRSQLSAERAPCRKPKQHVEVRARRTRRVSELPADDAGEISTEEATVLENVTLQNSGSGDSSDSDSDSGDDDDDDDDDDSSEFHGPPEEDLSSDDSLGNFFPSPSKAKQPSSKERTIRSNARSQLASRPAPPAEQDADEPSSVFYSAEESFTDSLVKPISRLSLNDPSKKKTRQEAPKPARASQPTRTTTPPPSPPPKAPHGLVSPTKKLPRIPMTPHRPNTDAFWDQELVNDWNTTHSPRKLLFDSDGAKKKITASTATALSPKKSTTCTAAQEREAKKMFQKGKQEMAEKFLAELDRTITDGTLGQLAAATGGVRIVWTNKLNTTAGRANWRRETLRPRPNKTDAAEGNAASVAAIRVLHHASIELAEKVIDDEHRLLNVLAHEFCHLANFMVSGITGNPHGREFKAWAAQCSRHFGARGIQVTTKHTYDIDFRYIWTCEACAVQFKRHSKSIDPTRHRCGACRGELRQTKPVPRGGGSSRTGARAGAGGSDSGAVPAAKPEPSAYQKFMKENMAVLRRENPGSPQKIIMKLVAERWTRAKKEKQALVEKQDDSGAAPGKTRPTKDDEDVDAGVARLHSAFVDLTLA